MTEYNIRLNPNCAAAVHTGLKFKAGDKGITFKIAVDELDTTGTTAKIVFQRANGTSVESDISDTNGVYTYKTLGNEFAVPGKTVADVKFYAADARVSTASFVFEVSGDTMDGLGAGAGGYSDRLEQLATEAEDAMKNAENVSKELENLLTVYQNKFGEVGVLNPKGTYNSATTYEAFDLVYYGGVSWLCLQRCTGVTPAEGACWQLFASADGGNAAKLGGKGASEYATQTDITRNTPFYTNAPLVHLGSIANLDTLDGIEPTSGMVYTCRETSENGIVFGYLHAFNSGYGAQLKLHYGYGGVPVLATRTLNNGVWSGWESNATTADLANYLPKSGGKVSTSSSTPFSVENTGSGNVMIDFIINGVRQGLLGFNGVDSPIFYDANHKEHSLLHTGNKPTGSYTGNGSATERTIATGGIGNVCLVYRYDGVVVAFVTQAGAIKFQTDGQTGNTYTTFSSNSIKFTNGVLTIATADASINGTTTYHYQVL